MEDANELQFTISLAPSLKSFDQLDFKHTTSINDSSVAVDNVHYSSGTLVVVATYSAHIQRRSISMAANLGNQTASFAIPPSTLSLTVMPSNLPAYYFEPSLYQEAKIHFIITIVFSGVCIALSVFDLFLKRKIAVTLLQFVQFRYLLCLKVP